MLGKYKTCKDCQYHCDDLCFYGIDDNKHIQSKPLPKDNYCEKFRNDFNDAFPEF